jgi:hypothetical protein
MMWRYYWASFKNRQKQFGQSTFQCRQCQIFPLKWSRALGKSQTPHKKIFEYKNKHTKSWNILSVPWRYNDFNLTKVTNLQFSGNQQIWNKIKFPPPTRLPRIWCLPSHQNLAPAIKTGSAKYTIHHRIKHTLPCPRIYQTLLSAKSTTLIF